MAAHRLDGTGPIRISTTIRDERRVDFDRRHGAVSSTTTEILAVGWQRRACLGRKLQHRQGLSISVLDRGGRKAICMTLLPHAVQSNWSVYLAHVVDRRIPPRAGPPGEIPDFCGDNVPSSVSLQVLAANLSGTFPGRGRAARPYGTP